MALVSSSESNITHKSAIQSKIVHAAERVSLQGYKSAQVLGEMSVLDRKPKRQGRKAFRATVRVVGLYLSLSFNQKQASQKSPQNCRNPQRLYNVYITAVRLL